MIDNPLVYLNGEFTLLSQAKISVLDRGFIFGDGIYEVIPVYARKMFRAEQHLARLFRSLDSVRIKNPHTKSTWLKLIEPVIASHHADDQMVYLQVTRGAAPRSHAFPVDHAPTAFIMTNPLPVPAGNQRTCGVACVSMDDQRWQYCHIKSTSLLGNIFAAQYAAENDAVETILFRDKFLTEASSSNVWIVKNGVVMGPPTDHLILEGIRYGLLQELCEQLHIPFIVTKIARDEVFAADEVILSSATKEVLPVKSIDGKMIGAGRPGPVYLKLYAGYQQAKQGNNPPTDLA